MASQNRFFFGEKSGGSLLAFTPPANAEGFQILEVLSATGDVQEAAANLFAAFYRLDEARLDFIVAERVPQQGIGAAINDRLTRAACYPGVAMTYEKNSLVNEIRILDLHFQGQAKIGENL